jgi:hypothetical protein
MERMLANRKTEFCGYFFLAGLDGRIVEFFDMAALQTNDVIVVIPLVQFEYRLASFEMVFHQQSGLLELGEHPVYRRQTHVLSAAQQLLVNVFRAQVALFAVFEQIQHLEPWQGGFEACAFEVFRLVHMHAFQIEEASCQNFLANANENDYHS